jgi:hypothetical protein
MMRNLCTQSLILTSIAIAIMGCRMPQATLRQEASLVGADQQSTPFLDRGQYSDRLGRALDDSLRNHRFTLPWIAVRGSDGSAWFIAERFESEHRFDRIYVRVTPEDKVTASITPYQFHASDWASLGRVFVGDTYRAEAESMTREITEKLNKNRK